MPGTRPSKCRDPAYLNELSKFNEAVQWVNAHLAAKLKRAAEADAEEDESSGAEVSDDVDVSGDEDSSALDVELPEDVGFVVPDDAPIEMEESTDEQSFVPEAEVVETDDCASADPDSGSGSEAESCGSEDLDAEDHPYGC